MSDIRAIKQHLKPWPSSEDPRRYYLNDWADRINGELRRHLMGRAGAPSVGQLVRWAKVWFDGSGGVHVEGVYDRGLSDFIADTISENVLTEVDYDPSFGASEFRWSEITDTLPKREEDETYFILYDGREYAVNVMVYQHERCFNPAYVAPDGEIRFESESTDLWDLVVKIVHDKTGEDRNKERELLGDPLFGIFHR